MDSGFAEIALQVIVILGCSKLLAVLLERLGQEAVVGELLLGVLLGPYLLGFVNPKGEAVLAFLSELGIIVLAFYIGLVAELDPLLKARRAALRVALLGMGLSVSLGTLFTVLTGQSWLVAFFMGAALMATSLGKVGRLLCTSGQLQTVTGGIILGAALIDDLLALWGLAGFHAWLAPRPFRWELFLFEGLLSLMILGVGLALGVRWAPRIFLLLDRLETRGMMIVSALIFCLALALLAQSLGLAVVVGAFAAGLMLEYVHREGQITRQVETLCDLFVPFYFVKAGALLDPTALLKPSVLLLALGLLAIALMAKLLGGLAVGQLSRRARWTIGIAMIPRGEVSLIFATFGLESGLLSKELYTAILFVVILTSVLAPLLLNLLQRRR
ncbi:MAG: cation:proton antiporter [Candidatus Bipolaricaulota bacterium]|nr:cation:proton antiporter [Candidatus Bipolaricaulota bacterium]MCS7274449.1 cation:proton antiporter [Candidatus Bipolaricaulota bacterium]MDW8110878.1 cation:proton antiporter [Candidatus Bipolaricaulota bacterium]MDW8329355.1 cation:proton antiporter [Candidatus Bipolaricaulota bacterium]